MGTLLTDPTTAGHDARVVRAFAEKVMRPGSPILLIDAGNERSGWGKNLDEAIAIGQPAYAVEVADDILATDADRPELAAQTLRISEDLRRAGYEPVLVNSGRPGNLHLFARITNRDDLDDFKNRARAAGLDVRQRIRPPLSPHRLGLEVSLHTPDDVAEALAALTAPASTGRQLTPRMQALLRQGNDAEHEYASRSEAILALALGFHNAGLSESDFLSALADPQNRAGDKIRGRRDFRGYVARCWQKAAKKVAISPPIGNKTDARERIAELMRLAAVFPWPGRAGTTDKLVLEALLRIALDAGKLTIHADVRTLAAEAGYTPETMSVALGRLRDLGWISLTRRARRIPVEANTWTLRVPRGWCTQPDTRISLSGCKESARVSTPPPVGDLWRRSTVDGVKVRGLGQARLLVWQRLDLTTSARPLAIADAIKRKERIVQRHLAVLRSHGLAVRDSEGWRRTDLSPEAAAEVLGVTGQREVQLDRYQRERKAYRDKLAMGEVKSNKPEWTRSSTGDQTSDADVPLYTDDDLERMMAPSVLSDDEIPVMTEEAFRDHEEATA